MNQDGYFVQTAYNMCDRQNCQPFF